MRQPLKKRKSFLGAAMVVAALGIAACGSSASSSGTTPTSAAGSSSGSTSVSTTSTGSSSNLAAVRAHLAQFQKVPSFTPPGPAIDVSSLKGKTIYSIPQTAAIPFLATTEQAEAAIAKAAGINFVEYPTQGNTNEWIRGIDQAVASHAGGILLNAMDPRLVAPQVKAAKSAGIPVVSAQFFDVSQVSQGASTLAGVRGDNFTQAGQLEADWAISDTNGKADVIVVENREQLSTQAMVSAIKAEFAKYCSACKVTYINVPATQWATQIQPQVQSALAADPNVNYVLPIYDPMSQFVIPAITAAGLTGKVHIATFNGTPFALKDLADGNTIKMDIGENLAWLAAANMDELFRTMLGKPAVANENTAMRVFTSANIGDTGNPPAYDLGLGSAWKTGYGSLWGVTP